MAGIVQMLHALQTPYGGRVLNSRMPTQREYEQYNRPEFKEDSMPHRRLGYLDSRIPVHSTSLLFRVCVYALAIVGLYSLIF